MRKNYNMLYWIRCLTLSLLTMISCITYAYDFEVDGVYYNIIASDQVEVTYKEYHDYSYESDYSGNLQIPSTIIYNGIKYSVTQIGDFSFCICDGLTSITIPNSVISIDEGAFWFCYGLTSITIPGSVTSIGGRAFCGCSGLTSITIPGSVSFIGTNPFQYCGLSSIKVESENVTYDSRDNCNAIIETSSNTLIAGCKNTIIPNSVTSIGQSAFKCGLTSISIPNSVTSIDERAFEECGNLTSITIPNSVTSIGDYTFYRCNGLTSITIPTSMTSIGVGAFSGCNALASIKVESGNVTYDSRDNCNAIIETSSNTLIAGCKNTIIPNNVTSIGQSAFQECSRLTSITIPNSVTSIGSWAFHSCRSLTSISIPNSVTSIDDAAFYGCEGLTSISIPNSVTVIGNSAFYDCSADVFCYATNVPNTAKDAFRAYSIQNSDLYVPASSVNSYKAKEPWKYFRSITAIEGSKTYSLSITATGNGSATYEGTTIRGKTKSYTVNEGTSVTITFTPDTGYRIKSLKVNGSSVTVSTSYTTKVNSDTSIEVEFEEIPQVDYTLSIKAVGNGYASYNGETIRETTKNYLVTGGSNITLTFTPDNGYRIKSLTVNGSNVTASSSYKTTVNGDTNIEVEFEKIPITYTFTIKASGNGFASYEGESIRESTMNYTVNEGSIVTVSFNPDDGYWTKSLIVNGVSMAASSDYTTTINEDTSIEVEFAESVSSFSMDGITYQVVSMEGHTVMVIAVGNELVLDIPEKVSSQNQEWTVIGINDDVLEGQDGLAAIIWGPAVAFTGRVTNPNLLLYVKDEAYAPASIKNVVVNGSAKSITLTDAQSGNNFYCPEAFTAQSINYTHNYLMKTGLHESRGWETIALPFDVQKISHSSKGEIIPFAKWTSDGSAKPFWLYELSGSGFVEAEAIKANTPYIISMPNNEAYPGEYQLTGRVTFLAENVEVKKSDEVQTATFSSNTFVPNFICRNDNEGCYALNVSNDYEYYRGAENEGSKFILNLRKLHPFEAYMTSTSGTRSIDIFDSMTTGIRGIEEIVASQGAVKVYDLSGRLIKMGSSIETIRQELPSGVYIINNKKMIIK